MHQYVYIDICISDFLPHLFVAEQRDAKKDGEGEGEGTTSWQGWKKGPNVEELVSADGYTFMHPTASLWHDSCVCLCTFM